MINAITKIQRYTSSGEEQFMGSSLIQDAVIRNFEVMGEAVKNIPDEFRQNHLEVDWSKIAKFRDVLIHQYFQLNLEVIWEIVEGDLADLRIKLEEIFQDLSEKGDHS
ncbi:MAG: DUF86 domain-containing protein [Thermostichus sp. HHBFW_bins_43]